MAAHEVTQTLRSRSSAKVLGDRLLWPPVPVYLDGREIGTVRLRSIDAVKEEALTIEDAQRGGFDTRLELSQALLRAGYRFKPLGEYVFYRCRFEWSKGT